MEFIAKELIYPIAVGVLEPAAQAIYDEVAAASDLALEAADSRRDHGIAVVRNPMRGVVKVERNGCRTCRYRQIDRRSAERRVPAETVHRQLEQPRRDGADGVVGYGNQNTRDNRRSIRPSKMPRPNTGRQTVFIPPWQALT